MSPAPKKQPATTIALPRTGQRDLVIDGHTFTADFDDAALLHDLLEVNGSVLAIMQTAEGTTEEKIAALSAMSSEVRCVVDALLGEGASDTIFEGARLPILRAVKLITELSAVVGPVYDAMFAEYLKA